jgi:hypothetical protein
MNKRKGLFLWTAGLGVGWALLRFIGSIQDEQRLRFYLRLDPSFDVRHCRVDRSILGEPSYFAILSTTEVIAKLRTSGFHVVQDSRCRDEIIARIRMAFPEEASPPELPSSSFEIFRIDSLWKSGWTGVAVVYQNEAYLVLDRS